MRNSSISWEVQVVDHAPGRSKDAGGGAATGGGCDADFASANAASAVSARLVRRASAAPESARHFSSAWATRTASSPFHADLAQRRARRRSAAARLRVGRPWRGGGGGSSARILLRQQAMRSASPACQSACAAATAVSHLACDIGRRRAGWHGGGGFSAPSVRRPQAGHGRPPRPARGGVAASASHLALAEESADSIWRSTRPDGRPFGAASAAARRGLERGAFVAQRPKLGVASVLRIARGNDGAVGLGELLLESAQLDVARAHRGCPRVRARRLRARTARRFSSSADLACHCFSAAARRRASSSFQDFAQRRRDRPGRAAARMPRRGAEGRSPRRGA